jgi:hypothetical protein
LVGGGDLVGNHPADWSTWGNAWWNIDLEGAGDLVAPLYGDYYVELSAQVTNTNGAAAAGCAIGVKAGGETGEKATEPLYCEATTDRLPAEGATQVLVARATFGRIFENTPLYVVIKADNNGENVTLKQTSLKVRPLRVA